MDQNSDVLSQSGMQTMMIQTGFSFKSPNPVRRSNQGRLQAALMGNRTQSVEELHQQLSKLVDQMDNKIEKVINRHDDEFLTAYRAQMIKVQRELSYFKDKANEQEFALRRDERINTLEESLLWFRNEAIRLGEEKEEYKRQLKELTLKYEGLQDDKRFLEEQAKATKKQTIVKSFQGDESGLLPQIAMKYSSNSNYTTTDALPRQGQQYSSLQKRSLFTHRERNRSIAETTTETPKLPRIISHSPQDSLMMDFDYSKEGIETLPPIDAPSSLPQEEAQKKQKGLGSASFMPGGGIARHSHHQSIPGKLGAKLDVKKHSIVTESEDARHTVSVQPRRVEQGHPSPSMRYEVKEQEEDEEQIQDIEQNGEATNEKENEEENSQEKHQTAENNEKDQEKTDTQTIAVIPQGEITEIPGTKLSAFVFQLIDAGIGRAEIVFEVDSYMRSEEQRVNSLLQQMRKTLEAKTNEIRKLKSQHNEQYYLRNQMEDIFFDCVEQVRLDAFNRQQLNMAPLLTARKREEETKIQHRRMSSGQHFTADERRKIIEQFLNNDQIVQNIHRLLFKKTEENELGRTDVFRSSNRYNSFDSEEQADQTYMLDTRKMKSTKHSTAKSIGLEQQLVRIDSQDYNELMKDQQKPPSKKTSQKMKMPQHSYKELQKLLGAKRGYILNHTVKDGQLLLKKV